MKSAVLLAGAGLLLAGAMASANPQPAAVPGDLDGDSSLPLNNFHHHGHHGHHSGGHHHHHGCHHASCAAKNTPSCVTVTKRPSCTVIKSCGSSSSDSDSDSDSDAQCTVTDTCTVRVPVPTTIYKNHMCTVTAHADPVTLTKMKVCTTTVEAFKTVTKCFTQVKTKTEYLPKFTTATATVTMVDPAKPTTLTKTKVATVTVVDPSKPKTVTKTQMKTATVTVVESPEEASTMTSTVTVTEPASYATATSTATSTMTMVNPPRCTPRPSRPCCLATQQQHVVGQGDDVFDIAAIYNTTVDSLFQDNSFLTQDSELKPGDILCVSPAGSATQPEKRDVAHHHHHHSSSCEEAPEQTSCDPPKKKHHHHHHHKSKHGKHHHHHHHHHHKSSKTTSSQTCMVTPEVDVDSCGDSSIHCGLCRAWHNVWPGDTTSNIAQRYQVSDGEVRHLNPWMGTGDKLNEGDWVCVAGCDIPIRFESTDDSSTSAITLSDPDECAPEHICVPCARPAVCPQSGIHSACPENFSCMKI